jgi:aryl-alcohol dehydrogenase-like predicted oxidoreductase
VVGRLAQGRRDRLVISTKYSLTMRAGDPNASGNHRKNMVRCVEDSLRRLGSDYIDLLYLHMWDYRTPVEEILRAFDDLVRAGKILYAGISDSPAWQIARMQTIAELRGWTPFVALQVPYNLTERTVERELMPMAQGLGIGVLPWSPLAGGVLSGKYSRADLAPDRAGEVQGANRRDINLATGRLTERTLGIAEVVTAIAEELGNSPSQVAMAWTLLHPSVTSPLIGARTCAQLDDNLGALQVAFTNDQIERLAAASHVERGFPHDLLAPGGHAEKMFGSVKVERPGVR